METLRSRHVRRVLVPVMAVSVLSACSGWKVPEMTPSQAVTEKEPGRVLLTMLDGDQIELVDPKVSDGVILGHPVDPYNRVYGVLRSDTLRVAADSVVRFKIREANTFPTTAVGLTFALLVAGAVAFVVVVNSSTICCQ